MVGEAQPKKWRKQDDERAEIIKATALLWEREDAVQETGTSVSKVLDDL